MDEIAESLAKRHKYNYRKQFSDSQRRKIDEVATMQKHSLLLKQQNLIDNVT